MEADKIEEKENNDPVDLLLDQKSGKIEANLVVSMDRIEEFMTVLNENSFSWQAFAVKLQYEKQVNINNGLANDK